ncbi:2'-5' RNA ligase family protein [Bacillus sp. AFS031507]|uniref:2'-5' RNA ligase family protein n=1 Tax=Bacillus sp. AFS031507 TaxID=2033496 RepID=UPI000BFBBA85|nr:mutarotase [Bacillus sp. AFS031507]PGY12678.1 mutarotase [Bacillus sp. AFS031507]
MIGRLNGDTLTEILGFLNEGLALEPNQHFYTKEDIHLTILSIISCDDTFDIGKINKEDYITVIDNAMNSLRSFKISFKGITASPSCVMIQGFPLDDNLLRLRNQLRHSFLSSHLKQSMDERYTLKTAHSTVIRFKNPLQNNKTFIDYLHRYREYNFGCVNFDRIDFVYNDWYMTNSLVKTLKTFEFEK